MAGLSSILDIIFFAVIAVILILRLRSVLGRRTGHERRPDDAAQYQDKPRTTPNRDNVLKLPGQRRPSAPAAEPPSSKPLNFPGGEDLRKADPQFDPDQFLHGARIAFEMIVTAFAAGDEEKLRPLLSPPVFDQFSAAIRERKARNETRTTSVVGIQEATIIAAAVEDRQTVVTVRFVSEQIDCTRNAEGHVLEGHLADVEQVTDEWRFARPLRARDPNWQLVGTFTPHD